MIPKYYEFLNKTKILSGYRAMENIPYELKTRGAGRPMVIAGKGAQEQGLLKKLSAAINDAEVIIGSTVQCPEPEQVSAETIKRVISKFKETGCDSLIALGDGSVFELGNAVGSAVFIVIPLAVSGLESAGEPDVAVLDMRMVLRQSPRYIASCSMDILGHAIETYTCLQKNPVSDAYAFSAINLIRENTDKAVRYPGNRKALYGLSNAAVLSTIAFKNSMGGFAHALAYGIEKQCGVSCREAIGIILPYCMEANMIKLDEYYSELLLPFSGAEIYSDTPYHERGRKLVQNIRNMLADFHARVDLPVCLSEAGVNRSDFDKITSACLNNISLLYNPLEIKEEDVGNILNMAY